MGRIRPFAVVVALLSLVLGGAVPASAAANDNFMCSGNFTVIPGGNYRSLTVQGFCLVASGGNVTVTQNVVIAPGAVLLTNYPSFGGPAGLANVNVGENVIVESGAVLLIGCEPSFGGRCTDVISGNLIGEGALGIIVHATTIEGSALKSGGSNGGNVVVVNNNLADPDAVEILDNTITGNLVCQHNSMVWDSAELTQALFPRLPEPNTVDGKRVGQCVTASPPGSGPF